MSPLAFTSEETSPYVRALLADQGIAAGSVDLAIDERDEMLGFLIASHEGNRERALFTYFRSGLSIADSMTQILRWRFGGLGGVERMLDFASGYGRVVRFLLRDVPAGRVWVSDIYDGAVAFQEERFGVHGIVSTVRPEDFACGERFDAILVTSLFTHLPEERFVGWLRVLLGLLRPGGALVFSVHDEKILEPGREMPANGLFFQELSESGSLSTSDYGSTWVTEEFVRGAVARAAGGPVSVHRIERGLCNFQDLYVAVAEEGVDFSGLSFQGEPFLQIDDCALPSPDRLTLRGWAVVRTGGVREVQVVVDGQVLGTAPVEDPRPDVAALIGGEFERCGWACSCPLPASASRSTSILIVRVIDARGVSHPLWASSIDAALLSASRQHVAYLNHLLRQSEARKAEAEARAAAEIGGLQARIAAMEASRFWKMRNAWFRAKRGLGLTEET
ncbi:MAG TPA: class I SAM-dependent methyltransferase [Thermoanaerobaculia bacterium]